MWRLYISESLAVNGGNLPLDAAVEFDIAIRSRWAKIHSVKLVQRAVGPMRCTIEVWESAAARDSGYDRALMYQNVYLRPLDLAADEGAQYQEVVWPPVFYKDRDAPDEERTWMLHCRITNHAGGTASDFDVVFKLGTIGEMHY